MQRRDLLKLSFGSLLATTIPRWTRADVTSTATHVYPDQATSGLTQQQWQVLVTVQAHLFPADANAPGAQDINAALYLHDVLANPTFDSADRRFARTGILDLQTLTHKQFTKRFIDLTSQQREHVLRLYEQTPQGSRWLNMILEYLMEALLTDPVYGGNPGGIGWQWLEHTPGSPRPPKHKRYFLL